MTSPVPPGDTTTDAPAGAGDIGDGSPVVDDQLAAVDLQLHAPGQAPGVTGPTRPNIIRAFPSPDGLDPYAPADDPSSDGDSSAKSKKNTGKS